MGASVGRTEDDDGEAFLIRMREIHGELADLNAKAIELAVAIQTRFVELFE